MDKVTITLADAEVQAWFGKLIDLAQDLRPVHSDFGEILIESTQRRSAAGIATDGSPWAPLAPATLARCSQDTALRDIAELVARGVLRRSAAGGRSTSYEVDDSAMTDRR